VLKEMDALGVSVDTNSVTRARGRASLRPCVDPLTASDPDFLQTSPFEDPDSGRGCRAGDVTCQARLPQFVGIFAGSVGRLCW
jgi:hypothetical protein